MSLYLALAGPERARRIRAALPAGHRLEAFATGAGLRRRAEDGVPPVGLVLAAQPSQVDGEGLLAELSRALPGCPRLLWSETDDLGFVARALEQGGVTRLLESDPDDERLSAALMALEGVHDRLHYERLEVERLDFAQEVLRDTITSLERHIDVARQEVDNVERLVTALRGTGTLPELARLAAERLVNRLPGRGVVLSLEPTSFADAHTERAGTQSGAVLSRIRLRGSERDLGAIELLRGHGRAWLTSLEQAHLLACEPVITLAAQGLIHRGERNDAQLATVLGLARLAEHRDDTTGRHLDRVSSYCRVLADAMRAEGVEAETLTPRYVDDLALSAPLHDIGKVAIPDKILLKPGKLDAEEWKVMQSHAELGARSLERILTRTGEQPYLRMGKDIAWCHHERWDGEGYPRGLRGTEIPLAARIMSVADVYDALTTERPYKKAWTHERAVAHIVELAGEQFDPEIVAVFHRHAEVFSQMRGELEDAPHPEFAA